jgi:hypothetical protein
MNLKKEGLFPWKEESKRQFKGIGNLPQKTNLKCKVRSKPKVGGQEYLDLYLMTKEKERLEKIGQVIGRIQRQTAKSWREVEKETAKVKKTVLSAGETGTEAKRKVEKTRKKTPQNPMKTIVLDY